MNEHRAAAPPAPGRWVSLHDKRITRIACGADSVEFHFRGGFTVIDGDRAETTKNGFIRLSGCGPEDFSCHMIRRKASGKGDRLRGRPVTLLELSDMLSKKGRPWRSFWSCTTASSCIGVARCARTGGGA